jgi:hypothetical protein
MHVFELVYGHFVSDEEFGKYFVISGLKFNSIPEFWRQTAFVEQPCIYTKLTIPIDELFDLHLVLATVYH